MDNASRLEDVYITSLHTQPCSSKKWGNAIENRYHTRSFNLTSLHH